DSLLSPFQQAKRYIANLPLSKHPRWLITCNFSEFLIYDMEKPNSEPEQIFLKDLPKDYHRLQFLVYTGSDSIKREMEISLKAGELVGKLYDLILKQYKNSDSSDTLKSLNMLCVRLVFCLYAEDSSIFGSYKMFGNYLKQFQPKQVREEIIKLFRVLDTKPENRDPYMNDDLSAFPYVNGGLFADENIEIPRFTEEIVNLLLNGASKTFNWSEISPTIFGAVFESTLNPETRRSGGMHYTSIENIHKVIDPLFLDDLRAELATILEIKVDKTRFARLDDFRNKLSSLTFLDPACGSGNFLTETYISLRRLENEALRAIYGGQKMFNLDGLIKVGIHQFYGIEINDFAVTVAKTALWIAESQMMQETEEIIEHDLDFLPLKSYANIVEGNSLRIDWESIVPKDKLSYIMGNPPFVGAKYQSKEQRQDLLLLDTKIKDIGLLDYVGGWYIKASRMMENTKIISAFVSTNSITQGGEPAILWKYLIKEHETYIKFAYRTFAWDSEANNKAKVHCVIIGFTSFKDNEKRKLFFGDNQVKLVDNISPYLIEIPTVLIEKRKTPICDVHKMIAGNKAVKCLPLMLSQEEKDNILKTEPQAEKYIKRMIGSNEFINNIPRYCLWLVNCPPNELRKMPEVMQRVKQVRQERLSSNDKQAKSLADTPTVFRDTNNPSNAIIIPLVSSQHRRYIPIGYIDENTIANNKVSMIPDGTIYEFGVLTSNVHNAWMRTVSMRMKSDYSYSVGIVYNNFPFPTPTPEQQARIERTAQAILNARALYPNCSLADLYDELTMPPELRKAHQQNDFAVMSAYGFDKKITESECVAELMKLYQKLIQ
ncbi:MAG: N-6 DNA methylase, partial [Ruminococcus sp.]|nr:N-6 DNA methylase [Ruminococcus sp.]